MCKSVKNFHKNKIKKIIFRKFSDLNSPPPDHIKNRYLLK